MKNKKGQFVKGHISVIENGRTLCVPCHKKTDTFGRVKLKNKNKIDIII